MGRNQYCAGRVYDLCVYCMTGTPEGSTESGFMEKPGIEPATPGLQGIALIHYTTGASVCFIDPDIERHSKKVSPQLLCGCLFSNSSPLTVRIWYFLVVPTC